MMPGAKGYVLKKILYPMIKVLYNLFYVVSAKGREVQCNSFAAC